MLKYEIVFIGHVLQGTVVPFEGPVFVELGGPVFYASVAAASLGRRVAAVTRASEDELPALQAFATGGVELLVLAGEMGRYVGIIPTANVDKRILFFPKIGKVIRFADLPSFEPTIVHLACGGSVDEQLSLLQELKARGCRVAVDMASFMLQVDAETAQIRSQDVPRKQEIVSLADYVKLDAEEGRILTGLDVPEEQARTLEDWGAAEILVTRSQGVVAHSQGKSRYAPFTNRSNRGRMGRGDTFMGAYLARRLDAGIEQSVSFAAALTSMKLESGGPFMGTERDVLARMAEDCR